MDVLRAMAARLLSAALLTGFADERLKNETDAREITPNCIECAAPEQTWSRAPRRCRSPPRRKPQFRLRVGDVRVFYDISDRAVEVLAIVIKSEAESWLAQFGNPE